MDSTHDYALILAGGSGTRFWPLSRNSTPKQLLHLIGDQTLLQQAVTRLQGLVPTDHIFVLTSALQIDEVRKQIPGIPSTQIIAEPCRRDTAPAIALGASLIAARDPEANMMVLPSDQLIQDIASFQSLMRDALAIASRETALITMGIKPTWPCPSYGYIEMGDIVPGTTHTCRLVQQFREKPDSATAATYLAHGGFCWNAGIFVWSLNALRQELAVHCPQLAQFLAWISASAYFTQSGGNAVNTPIVAQNSYNNIVFTTTRGKTVALLGVDDLIIVDTQDALLVATKNQADAIKSIVKQLPENLL